MCSCSQETRWWLLRLQVCNVFNLFEVGKRVQVFDLIVVHVEFTMLRGFDVLGYVANTWILLACYFMAFRMV